MVKRQFYRLTIEYPLGEDDLFKPLKENEDKASFLISGCADGLTDLLFYFQRREDLQQTLKDIHNILGEKR